MAKDKLQNVGAGDPPSTILIDGMYQLEGVEELVYLGSKQSWLLPTGCSTQDWTCLFSDEFSTEGMELQFSHAVSAPKYTCTKH